MKQLLLEQYLSTNMCNDTQNNFYVYALKRPDKFLDNEPQPFYIGKGKNNRLRDHFKLKGYNPYKDNIIRKLIRLELEIICEKITENLTEEEAFKKEIELIAFYGRRNNNTGILANMTNGGEGSSGAIRSEEYKRRASETQKGKHHTEETKQKISKITKGRVGWLKGKHLSKEQKRKIGERSKGNTYMLGKHHSKEARQKMSDAHRGNTNAKGYKHTEETKRKMSESRKGNTNAKGQIGYWKDKHLSEETKKKISESCKGKIPWNKGKHHSEESNNNNIINTIDNPKPLIEEKII